MSECKYEVIAINKAVTKENLIENLITYLYSRLGECLIESSEENNVCTLLISSAAKSKANKRPPYMVLELIVHSDSCAVSFQCSKARPAVNAAFAVAAAPIFLPASGILLGTAALRLWNMSSFKKDIINYIKAYVN